MFHINVVVAQGSRPGGQWPPATDGPCREKGLAACEGATVSKHCALDVSTRQRRVLGSLLQLAGYLSPGLVTAAKKSIRVTCCGEALQLFVRRGGVRWRCIRPPSQASLSKVSSSGQKLAGRPPSACRSQVHSPVSRVSFPFESAAILRVSFPFFSRQSSVYSTFEPSDRLKKRRPDRSRYLPRDEARAVIERLPKTTSHRARLPKHKPRLAARTESISISMERI